MSERPELLVLERDRARQADADAMGHIEAEVCGRSGGRTRWAFRLASGPRNRAPGWPERCGAGRRDRRPCPRRARSRRRTPAGRRGFIRWRMLACQDFGDRTLEVGELRLASADALQGGGKAAHHAPQARILGQRAKEWLGVDELAHLRLHLRQALDRAPCWPSRAKHPCIGSSTHGCETGPGGRSASPPEPRRRRRRVPASCHRRPRRCGRRRYGKAHRTPPRARGRPDGATASPRCRWSWRNGRR